MMKTWIFKDFFFMLETMTALILACKLVGTGKSWQSNVLECFDFTLIPKWGGGLDLYSAI